MRFERALIRLCARRLTRYPRWSAARRMRARALVDTLAPGVNARDTAERETPARLATSAAVTNARRADDWLTSTPGCTRVQHDTTTLNKPARLARDFRTNNSRDPNDPRAMPIGAPEFA